MFADEDFDPDEDFLNDVTQKESQYYSQKLNSDEESCAKRFKNDEYSSRPSCSKSISDLSEPINSNSSGDSLGPNNNDIGSDKSHRRNLILERLKILASGNTSSDPSGHQHANKTNSQSSNPGTSRLTPEPKTRNLQAFGKNNVTSYTESTHRPENKSHPNIIEAVASSSSKLDLCRTIGKSPLRSAKLCNKPVTLVRKFPGPAGLLPDSTSGIIPPVIQDPLCHNNSNDGINIDVVENSSVISKYCSQNTTNLFSEGPWQLLMNDLRPDFLRGHEISIIKQKVLTNSYENDEVPFLAGIVQRVDFNRLDPLIVLKDYTGMIEGTICKDILVEYPQLLDIGVVLFLGNVGLLTVGNYLKKCHVIITLKNLVNVYTEKSQIFSKSEMEARIENLTKHNRPSESVLSRDSNSSLFFNSKMGQRPNMDRVKDAQNIIPALRPGDLKTASNSVSSSGKFSPAISSKSYNSEICTKSAMKTSKNGCKNLFADNRENSNSFQAKSNPSQSTEPKSNKFTFESEEFKDFDDDFTCSFLDINMASKTQTNLEPARNTRIGESSCVSVNTKTVICEKNPVLNTVHFNTSLSQRTEQLFSKVNLNNDKAKKFQVKAPSAAKENYNPPKSSSIESKLSMFRSKAELTPQTSDDLDLATSREIHNKQNEAKDQSSFTSGLLLNKENDSDEELFSQVDIESIFSRYDSPNDVD